MVNRSFVLPFIVLAADLLMNVAPARACKLVVNRPYAIDPQAGSTDSSPPSVPVATVQSIRRGKGPEREGCSQSGSSCDDLGSIAIAVAATDDQTAAADLGYRVELVSGSLPAGLSLPLTAVTPATSTGLLLGWIDEASDDQEALAFALAIRAVDKAGNEGPATSVEVRDAGSGGCAVVGHRSAASRAAVVASALLVSALLRRRRRRSALVGMP